MGEVFAGPGFRTCCHPGCRWPATATLGFLYSTRQAWLEDMSPKRHPSTYDLCSLHAQRFKPPLGWTMSDRRETPEPLFTMNHEDVVAEESPPIPDEVGQEILELPGG